MSRTLKQAVRDQVQAHRLDDRQATALQAMQEAAGAGDSRRGWVRWGAPLLAAACALAIVVVFLAPDGGGMPQPQRIADEVAYNHVKLKPLEVESAEFDELRDYLGELEFSPVETALLDADRYEVLGARYCSIEGQPAAQIRVRDRLTGEIHSLYQTRFDPERFAGLSELEQLAAPLSREARGMGVDIWVEKGLLFAITRQDPDANPGGEPQSGESAVR